MQYEFIAAEGPWYQDALKARDKLQKWGEWQQKHGVTSAGAALLDQVLPDIPIAEISGLPWNSVLLRIFFALEKPYMSRDDAGLHVLDNPLKRERIFKRPMIASSGWKGALRAAFRLGHPQDQLTEERLFGVARAGIGGERGRLEFFATFFDFAETDIEIINPHERDTGGGKQPIDFEVVRIGAKGRLQLLYVPLGPADYAFIGPDLVIMVQAVRDLLTLYGFGAKTSLGYGVARPVVRGELFMQAKLPPFEFQPVASPASEPEPPSDTPSTELSDHERRFLPHMFDAAGHIVTADTFTTRFEANFPPGGKRPKKMAQAADRMYRTLLPTANKLQPTMEEERPPASEQAAHTAPFTHEFFGFDELVSLAKHIAEHLQEESEPQPGGKP